MLAVLPGLFRDQMEDDEAQIAVGEEAAQAGPSASAVASMVQLVVGMVPAGEAPLVLVVRVSVRHKGSE